MDRARTDKTSWDAGFATDTELQRFSGQQNLSQWGWQSPTLIVVDCAAARADLLHIWLAELADNERDGAPPLRLLLLERHADPASGWWRSAFGSGGADTRAIARLLAPQDGPMGIGKIDRTEDRRAILTAVLSHKEVRADERPPEPGTDPYFNQKLAEITWGGEPLFLMMAALVAAKENFAAVLALSGTDLAFRIGDDELARIGRIARAHGQNEPVICHMAAFVTLCQGLTHQQAEECVGQEKLALGRPLAGDPPDIMNALVAAMPGSAGTLEPILPDLIGEAVILREFAKHSAEQGSATVLRATQIARRSVAETVIRAAQDYGLDGHRIALDWLGHIIGAGAADVSALTEIANLLPHQTVVMAPQAAAILAQIAEITRGQLRHDPSIQNQTVLATSLNNLANRLSALGRREEALAVATEAVEIYRALAAVRPDAFRPDLAGSLNNLANRLSALGRREEALTVATEAVDIYRALAAVRPGAFRPDLATSLNNLANRLSALGRREEALTVATEAVDIYRALAAVRPDAFRPDLAGSLNNLANRLSELGRREEALAVATEAVDIYRALAAVRPDAFRPDVAGSLNNLAGFLSELGRREEALAVATEAVEIRRALAAVRPDAFRPDVAMSLNNLANRLSKLGRREEALAVATEAVDIYRALAAVRPDAFRPDVAGSLNNLASFLSELGRREEALTVATEAADIYRALAAERPDAFLPDLATSLNNLAGFLSALGRREEALAVATEAVDIYRALAAERPDAFRPDLAMSLNNLAGFLSELGRREEALAVATEAVTLLQPHFLKLPPAFAQWMVVMCRAYMGACEALERVPDAALLGPILKALQRLEERRKSEGAEA